MCVVFRSATPTVMLCFAIMIGGCATAPPLQLAKPGGSYQDFSTDRYECVKEASRPYSGAYVNAYGGSSSSVVMPSRGVYLSCMAARGWHVVQSGGYVPETLIQMAP
jgi:hypothetical protein